MTSVFSAIKLIITMFFFKHNSYNATLQQLKSCNKNITLLFLDTVVTEREMDIYE